MKTAQAARIDKASIRQEIELLTERYELIHLEKKDVQIALYVKHPDLEDVLQYTLSQKVHCANVVSNDRHFDSFADVIVTKPGKIRKIQLG
jgi:predicted nucleic acid-binding protein